MAASEVLLDVKDVTRTYKDGERTLQVLRGVNLTVRRGEFLAIVGASGSGKSTLMHLMGALDRPTTGSVSLEGVRYDTLGAGELARVRGRSVGFIYQFHHLLPDFTALENVYLPAMIQRRPTAFLIDRATELLGRVGLAERLTHRPQKLSGGEQQRVALARALMNDPALVLADEPTGDLDQKTGRVVLDVMLAETTGRGKSLVIVTHDPEVAARADRRLRLDSGQLAAA